MAEFGEEPLGVAGKPDDRELITGVRIFQNNPNPFKSGTLISYQLPANGQVKITVYNIAGQKVQTLFDGVISAGTHTVRWNGRDQDGAMAASGVYLYRLQAEGKSLVGKMTLLR